MNIKVVKNKIFMVQLLLCSIYQNWKHCATNYNIDVLHCFFSDSGKKVVKKLSAEKVVLLYKKKSPYISKYHRERTNLMKKSQTQETAPMLS